MKNISAIAILGLLSFGAGLAAAQAGGTSVETVDVPTVLAFGDEPGTRVDFAGRSWESIQTIEIEFETESEMFNTGTGPNGGVVGVQVDVLTDDTPRQRIQVSSVIAGNQTLVLYPGTGDPQMRYERVVAELLDGHATIGLGAYESFPTYTDVLVLEEPSTLTLRIDGIPVTEIVSVDIRPGACPNALNPGSHGVVRVAVAGSPDLDVAEIDPASVRLGHVAPIRSRTRDVIRPRLLSSEDCEDLRADGLADLVLVFETEGLAGAISPRAGATWVLVFEAETYDGRRVLGSDEVRLVPPPHKPRPPIQGRR